MVKLKVMKLRSTTPAFKGLTTKSVLVAAAVIMAVTVPVSVTQPAAARNYDAEIQAVQDQISQYKSKASKLRNKADTLANELAKLSSEKATIQSQIRLSEAKQAKLKAEIAANEQKIEDNKDGLGVTLADMYVDDSISPLEMLASSSNIGDYVDKQSYRASVNDQLQAQIDEIEILKVKLEKQQVAVVRALADQNNQRKELVAKEAERQRIMSETRGEEASYNKLSKKAKAQKEQIIQAQNEAIANAYSGGGGGSLGSAGNLPAYASWSGGSCYVDNGGWSHGGASGGGLDPLGYGCNQCVSYTAWKMAKMTGYAPSYWGNANMWPASARAAGFKTGNKPRDKGPQLGVISAGQYGHIVYIESADNVNGTVNISQYNEWIPGKGFGHYSTRSGVSSATYDTYIYL